MQIKKTVCLLLCLTMLLGMLAGCAKQEMPSMESSTPPVSDAPSVSDNPPEDSTPPEETDPPIDYEAIVAALDVDENIKPELVRAAQMGLPLDKVGQDTISGEEFSQLLDVFVGVTAPEKLESWQNEYPVLRSSQDALIRFDAIASLYLAINHVGGLYMTPIQSGYYIADTLTHSWDEDYLNWELYGGFDAVSSMDSGYGTAGPLDGSSYYFILGTYSFISKELPFAIDEASNSLRVKDNCTYLEALLAVLRIYEMVQQPEPEEIDPQRLAQAVELGIVEETLISDPNATVTRGEMTEMLNNVHTLRYGENSRYLTEGAEILPEEDATRMWFASCVYHSAMEISLDGTYESAQQWMKYVKENENIYSHPNGVLMGIEDGIAVESGFWTLCDDGQGVEGFQQDGMEDWECDYQMAANYVLCAPDRTNGEKVLGLNGISTFQPGRVMTVGEAVQAAMRYYNSIEPAPELVSCSDITDYDHSIITDGLFTKETDLPAASCQKLPAEWHGILVGDLAYIAYGALNGCEDKVFQEEDLDVIKEAGLNFMGFAVDFSWLQGRTPEAGKLDENRLKVLDQVIAWRMEKDIHIDLRCSGVGGYTEDQPHDGWFINNQTKVNGTEYIQEFAAIWGALARRYKDIPNEYLSFNLLIEAEVNSEENYARFFAPAVEAIRESTPSRCIIADVHAAGITGESMAKLGVALSYHQYDPREFSVLTDETIGDAAYLSSVTWPYKGIDAEATMDMKLGGSGLTSPVDLIAMAEKYGVGIMMGEFGVFGPPVLPPCRYTEETLTAYMKDMTAVFEQYDLAWCWGSFSGNTGLVASYPSGASSSYSTREGVNYYVDDFMMTLFQEINGVK